MINDLFALHDSFLTIKDAFKVVQQSTGKILLKTKYSGMTLDEKRAENNKTLEHSEELIILSMFAIFERMIRDLLIENAQNIKVSNSTEFEKRFLLLLKDKLEFLEVYKLLKIFDFLPDIEHSRIKQIAEYRNWIAHGKNQKKLPSNKALNPRTVLEELNNYIKKIENIFM